jgi:hypothetical protein
MQPCRLNDYVRSVLAGWVEKALGLWSSVGSVNLFVMKQCIIFEIDKSECVDFTRDEIIEAVNNDRIQLKGKRAFVAFHSLDYLRDMLSLIERST